MTCYKFVVTVQSIASPSLVLLLGALPIPCL